MDISDIMKGNKEAMAFARILTNIAHGWDDIVDKDKPIKDDDIFFLLWNTLIGIQSNKFYDSNKHEFLPIMNVAILNWITATKMERNESESDKAISFIIRSGFIDVLIHAATLIGGYAHGLEVTPKIRRFTHREGYQGYLDNLGKESRDRKNVL